MTADPHATDWGIDPYPLPADHAVMDNEATYRERERRYRDSSAYARMQKRYPELRYWIARCCKPDLIGGAAPDRQHPAGSVVLLE